MTAFCIACAKDIGGCRHAVSCDVCDCWQHRLHGTGCPQQRLSYSPRMPTLLIIYSKDPLVDYSLVFGAEEAVFFVYCCTGDGKLYKMNHLDIKQKMSSKPVPGDDVFSELLDAGDLELCISTEPVYQLQSADLVYKFEAITNITSLCVSCGFVAVTCKIESELAVQIYFEKDLSRSVDSVICPVRVINLKCLGQLDDQCLGQIITKYLTSGEMITTHTPSSDCIDIPAKLFKAIVGQDVCLLNSPAILVCPPDGSVYFAPVRALDTSLPRGAAVTSSVFSSAFKLLCETADEVMTLGVMKIKITKDKQVVMTEMLVACCQNGLVCMIGLPLDETSDAFPQTWTFPVDSPIKCVSCFKDKLYHSTGRYVCETTVTFTKHSSRVGKFIPHTEVRRFQLAGVEHITAYAPDNLIETDDTPCVLHCCRFDGKVTTLNTAENIKDYKPYVGCNFADTMKETLLAIDSVDKKKGEIDRQLQHYEHLLRQINIVATLYRHYITFHDKQLKSKGAATEENVPVKCIFKARIPEGEKCDFILIDCEITNQMPCALSCDWSVLVTIDQTVGSQNSISRAFKLDKDLGPSQSLTISIPVDLKSTLFEMEASLFFILRLQFKDSDTISLCVPVTQESVDVLYFIHTDANHLRNMKMKSLGSSSVQVELLKIAKSRPAYNMYHDSTADTKQSTVSVSSSVCLKKDQSYLKDPTDPSSILSFLLQNATISQQSQTDNGCYHTFLGQPVHLSVTVNQMKDEEETSQVAVSICSDLVTAAAFHKAVTCRLQALSTEHMVQKIHHENLKRKLYELQELETDLTRLRTDRQCKDLNKLAEVYEKLRKITSLGQ